MPAPTGKHLERLVAAIQYAESIGAIVTWNDTINGRQFDVTVRFKYGLHSYLTVIECKEYTSKVSVEKVDALVTKSRSVNANANKAILVSTRGFQSGCFPVAEQNGIQLLVLTESSTATGADLIARIAPALNIFDVTFVTADGAADVEFEDWGGRLAYLMSSSTVRSPTRVCSPNELVNSWQTSRPEVRPGCENSIELPLDAGTILEMLYEEPAPVVALRFKCALIDVIVPKAPVFDNHIRQALLSKVELHDGKGNLIHTAKLNDIPLGFDTAVALGRFYELPTLCNRYYCEKIENELVTWVLVESYQYGVLAQCRLQQKLAFGKHYVPVADEVVTRRLQRMLDHYLKRPGA